MKEKTFDRVRAWGVEEFTAKRTALDGLEPGPKAAAIKPMIETWCVKLGLSVSGAIYGMDSMNWEFE